MIKRFVHNAVTHPQNIAIIIEETSYTYEELYAAAKKIAFELRTREVVTSLIGVYTDNNFYTYASILGVLLAGYGFVPLNSKFPISRLSQISNQINLELVLGCSTSEQELKSISFSAEVLLVDSFGDKDELKEVVKLPERNIAYILFTSGSTGVPKGIPITQGNFSHFLNSLLIKYPLDSSNKVLQCFELSFDVSIACTFLALSSGSTLVIPSLKGIIAVNAFKAILDHEVDFVTIAPSAVTYLVNYKLIPQFKLPFVKITLFTGEALHYSNAVKWMESMENATIHNAYGPTEVTVWSYFYSLSSDTPNEVVNGLCPIGKPLDGVKSKIEVIEEGSNNGELLLSGKHVFEKYWKNELKSLEVFEEDNEGLKWYRTGDLVTMNNQGNVMYINRLDNQVKINGYRIELGEIEFVLKTRLNTGLAVVVVSVDVKGNDQLTAFVDKELNSTEIKELAKNLTFYMVPKSFICIKNIPLNTNGKTDRKKLIDIANEHNSK